MSQEFQKDEALFEQLRKQKKRRRRRVIITVAVILLVVAVALVTTVSYLRTHVRERYAMSGTEVLSYEVKTGTLSTVVSGNGILAEDELESLTVPEGVEITEVLVEAFDTVTEGQVLATVDMSSVLTAMASLQDSLEELDDQISDAEDDKVSSTITTAVQGRVKVIYAEKGMSVTDCMVEHGALAVMSLDGFMALELESQSLKMGDAVTVTRQDGKELKGTVDSVIGGVATILVSDDGPRVDEEVTVSLDGTVLGSGKLYIHEPMAITGYAGTIQSLQVAENTRVYKGGVLFRLTDTATTHNYDALLRSRAEQEETLLELLNLRRTGAVLAPFAGSVYTVDYDETLAPLSLATLSPDRQMTVTISVDESDILSLELGQQVEVTVSSLSDEAFMGLLTEIDRSATVSGTYAAVVTLDKADGMLPGMTAELSVRITGVENAMLIPVDALHETRTGAFVYTTYDAETETFGGETPVTVGLIGSNEVEILSGLKPGDTIWYTEELSIMDFFANMAGMSGGSGSRPGGASGSGGQRPQGGAPGNWG